jgi:hypothetical protein
MAQDRTLTLHFNDGTKIAFDFPEQASHALVKEAKIKELLASPNLVIEAEGQVMIFPMTSIKYIAFNSFGGGALKGPVLPKQAITNARVIDS